MSDPPAMPQRRRGFLAQSAIAAAAIPLLHAVSARSEDGDTEPVVVGVMGMSRGSVLASSFARIPGVIVRYVCDVDAQRLHSAHESFAKTVAYPVKTVDDFRRILDDPETDALIVAAPNHWHAPAGILACAAGKHAYVEKPCCHNPREGELLIQAARRYQRCVQMGNQRRSGEKIREAISLLHSGRIGRVYYSRSWYANSRGSIGTGQPTDVPKHLNYDLWQGPAPRLPYTSNRLHYDWHWNWHFGNGELGNNGIHSIDLSRWGLDVEYPTRVVSSGGRFLYADDQETPDTQIVSFEFPGRRQIVWEGLSCSRDGLYGDGFGTTFHGESGSLRLGSWGYTIHDEKGAQVLQVEAPDGLDAHTANFIAAVRANDPSRLHSEIEEGHKSTLLCHLGNIAVRTGDTVRCDPANGHILQNPAAGSLWSRTYEPGWEPEGFRT